MAGEKIKILLIEDNPGDARLIKELLTAKGSAPFILEHADRLSIGLNRLAQGDIDVILLDLSLPDSQGLDGLNKICEQTPKVPVVVLSSLNDEAVAVNAVQEGAQDYLVKGNVDSDLLVRSLYYAMERQHLRVALSESEGRYRLLADNAADVIWTANMKWQITYVSPSIKRLLGYTVEEMKKLAIRDMLTPDSFDQAAKLIKNQMDIMTQGSQNPTLSLTLEHVRKDGSTLWAEVMLSFLWDKDGKLNEVLGVSREITERKKAEEALRQSEQRYRLLAENVKDIIWTRDMNLRTTYVSPSVTQMSGYSVEEVMSLSIEESLTPASLEIVQSALSKIMAEVKEQKDSSETVVLEVELIHKEGRIVPVEMKVNLLHDSTGRPTGFLGVTRDITERKKAEEALRESEEELQAIFDSSMNGIALLDLEGRLIKVNKRVLAVGGYEMEEISGKPLGLLKMFTTESIERMASIRDMILSGKEVTAFECEVYTKSGTKMSLEINVGPFLLKGQLFGLVAVMTDITERKRMEEELRRLSDAVRMSTDSIVISDLDGNIVDVNEATLKIQGVNNKADLIGLKLSDFIAPEEQEEALRDLSRVIEEGCVNDVQYHISTRDGRRILVESNASVMRGENGEPVGAVAVTRDITERKRMEDALRESEEKHRLYFESISDVIYSLDSDFTVLSISPSVERVLGYRCEEFVGQKIWDLNVLAPEYLELALSDIKRVLSGERIISSEYEFIAKDGTRKFGDISGAPIFSADGEVIALVSVARDITERKKMAEELLRLSDAVRMSKEAIAITDLEGKYLEANDATLKMHGVENRADFIGKRATEFIAPEDIEWLTDEMEKTLTIGYVPYIQYHCLKIDGSKFPVEASISVIKNKSGEPTGYVAVARDITERKRMEEALRQSEHNYRLLFEGTIDGMFVTDAETVKVVLANQTAARMCGLNSVEDAIGGNPIDLVHPDDRERVLGFLMEDVTGEGKKEVHEFRAITKDGREIWLSGMGTRIEYEGKPAVLSSIRDITEHKKAEKALRESEEKFRSVAETASDAIISLDSEGKIVFWNQAAEAIFGYPAREVMGKPLAVIMPQRFHDVHEKAMKRVVSTGERRLAGKTVEVSALRKDSSEFPMEFTVAGWKSGENIYSTAIARDITERKEMEQQLQLASRLAAVGELAAGVAHELNNPIAAIQGFAQFLTARKDLDADIRKDLDTIYRESQRAAKITQNLLTFARRHEPEKQLISLNEIIEETLELQAHPMKVNNIELVVELAPDLPKTLADFHQMQQVFVNIINNAEQALIEIHRKGRLVVKTKKAGNIIQISFADNGPGIPEENLKRIFDPFFTTKEVGKGTGLGLSICYGIVEAHGGRIYARSKLGQGATFVVELPIASKNELVAEEALLKPASRGVKWKKQKEQY
jgi:PAS domain S-box-containing protein